jgi:hypothetical protein
MSRLRAPSISGATDESSVQSTPVSAFHWPAKDRS